MKQCLNSILVQLIRRLRHVQKLRTNGKNRLSLRSKRFNVQIKR